MQGPPDTAAFYHAAYVAAAVLYTAYSVGLWWRARRLRRAWSLAAGVDQPQA